MDAIHDMGGMDGFGPVNPDPNEPVFHAPWEGRVYAMQRAMGFAGAWSIDTSRHTLERMPPALYLSVSYYKRWEWGIERNLTERGLAGADELAAGHALHPAKPLPRKLTVANIEQVFSRAPYTRPPETPALFKVGDRVLAKQYQTLRHTRLPRYVRGHVGIVERVHGCHVYPDTVAHDQGEHPHWLYTVCFEGPDLWGEGSDPTLKVSVEAFEPYLEAAPKSK